jgi:hypothetical protein
VTPVRSLACVVTCLAWLVVSTTYAADARAADPAVQLGGSELPGGEASTDPAEPVELTAGLWADELGPESSAQSTHHFRYQRAIADSTVHIGVIGASRSLDGVDGVEVEVTAEGEDCATGSSSANSTVYQGSFGHSLAIGPDEAGSRDAACLTAPALDIAISRDSSVTEELPIAIKLVEEAPATGVDSLPEPDDELVAEPVSSSDDAEQVDGAASFDAAPELDADRDGIAVDTTVTEGEERLYRVPLTWGERLEVTARVPAQDEPDEGEFLSSASVDVSFVTPERDTFQSAVSDASPVAQYYDEDAEAWDATPEVAYRNRFNGVPAWLPGDYWVAVAVSPADEDADPLDVPIELTVIVDGDETGTPTYPNTITAPGGESGPGGYAPDTPYLVGEDEFAAVPSGDGDSGFWGVRRWSGVGLGVLSLALLGAGVWRLLARRA